MIFRGYKNIIWDFDGTLFDTYPIMINAFKKALEDEGIYESYDFLEGIIKQSVSQTIDYFKKHYKIDDSIVVNFLKYEKAAYEKNIKAFDHACDICKAIDSHDKRNFLYTHRDDAAKKYLKDHNIQQHFTDFITSADGFKRKPSPEALNFLMNKHQLIKSETLMVGDRRLDIEAAKNGGIKACFFNPDHTNETFDADYVIYALDELYDLLELKALL